MGTDQNSFPGEREFIFRPGGLKTCGSSNSAIELTIPELERYSGYAGWVDVCRGYE